MTIQDPDLDCRQVVELVTEYLESALGTHEAEQLEQHLLICDACQTYVDQHRTVIRSLPKLAPVQHAPDQGAREAALQMFRRMRKRDSEGGDKP
jgi:anti-sigma factor RsiW